MLDTGTILERPAPEATRREQAKSGRRMRVVEATCDLLREVGVEALSMKMVAARARVSLSTVYNLFGSKQAVLAMVFDLDLLRFEERVAAAGAPDALERIFASVDIAAELYGADPDFYRAIMGRWLGAGAEPFLKAALREPRNRFWRGMIASAVDEGLLEPRADPTVLAALAVQIFSGVLADWISGEITVDELSAEGKFGFAVAFFPFAAAVAAERLRRRIDGLHRSLSRAAGAK